MTDHLTMTYATPLQPGSNSPCDEEPIHLISAIQPHGVLMVVEEPTLCILRISDNAGAFLLQTAENLLGKTLDQAIGTGAVDELCSHLFQIRVERTMVHFMTWQHPHNPDMSYHLFGHRRGRLLLLELEPATQRKALLQLSHLNTWIQHIRETGSLTAMLKALVNWVSLTTGFERVMVYRFEPDFSGQVIAETRLPTLESFQYLYFPASDIPLPARRMFALSPLRHLPDVDYQPVPVSSLAGMDEAMLNLGHSQLRSVSPTYVEYLKNMGVRATAVLPIMVEKKLWGLISCMNHSAPLYLPPEQRAPLIFVVQMIATLIPDQVRMDSADYLSHLERHIRRMDTALKQDMDLHQTLAGALPQLLDDLGVTGGVLLAEGCVSQVGRVPEPAQLKVIVDWLKQQDADVYATAQLAADCAEALGCHEMASGLLSIRLSRTGNDRLIWFRPEVPTEIEWAGNPDKPYEFAADGTTPMPHPRTSFARWKTTMRQRARPWRDCELEFASRLRLILLEFMVDRSLARLP